MEQYNKIAKKYEKTFSQMALRKECYGYSFLKNVKNVRGKKILDVGCGTGYYSKIFRRRGARVLGIDISKEMIRLAKNQEKKEKLGIDYIKKDARKLEKLGNFDLVTATLLLHYAKTKKNCLIL